MTEITPELLRELIAYDPESGVLVLKRRHISYFPSERIWKIWNTKHGGAVTGAPNNRGYGRVALLGGRYLAHRVAWAVYHGEWPEDQIDHINGNRSDNRICNLRVVNAQQNGANKAIVPSNVSGMMGVHFDKRTKTWLAHITINKKTKNLGRYASFEEACAVRKAAEEKYGFHPNHGRPRN